MARKARAIMPAYCTHAAVAQWIEYWPPKPRVVGSIPASRAISPGNPATMRVPRESSLPANCTVPQTCSTTGQNRKVQDVKNPPHTERRGNQWWYRRRVPTQLSLILGRNEYRESLKTSDVEVAR